MKGLGLQALEPPKRKPVTPTGPSVEQAQFLQVAKVLSDQERAQLRVGAAGAIGIVLLCATGYLIWGRRT